MVESRSPGQTINLHLVSEPWNVVKKRGVHFHQDRQKGDAFSPVTSFSGENRESDREFQTSQIVYSDSNKETLTKIS